MANIYDYILYCVNDYVCTSPGRFGVSMRVMSIGLRFEKADLFVAKYGATLKIRERIPIQSSSELNE